MHAALVSLLEEGASKEYNGWTNKPTWAASLWLDNDYASYQHARTMAQAYGQDADRFAGYLRMIHNPADSMALKVRFPSVENVYIAGMALKQSAYQIADTMRARVERDQPDIPANLTSDLLSFAVAWLPYEAWARTGAFGTPEAPMPDTYADIVMWAFNMIDWRAVAQSIMDE